MASGCIVAMVRFLNENGEEIPPLQSMMNGLNMHSNPLIERVPKHCLVVPEEQMYQMQQYIQEAKHRESVSIVLQLLMTHFFADIETKTFTFK